jgi:hypothetical protein
MGHLDPARTRPRTLVSRLAAGMLLVVLAIGSLGAPQRVAAWGNNADNLFGTHDWILAQALRVLGGAPDWMNVQVALEATDDPDTIERQQDPSTTLWHVYKEKGRRGGAPSAVLTRYAQTIDAVARGDQLATDGDAAGARAAYDEASRLVGLLAHYAGDVSQPFHSAYAGLDDKLHSSYERIVGAVTRSPGAKPQWQRPAHEVTPSTNVRRTIIRTAAYSRQFYKELRTHLAAHPGELDARASEITGLVLKRAADDLASIIAAIATKGGYGPEVKVSVKIRDHYIAAGRGEMIYLRATDLAGNPVEGVEFAADIPDAEGGTHRERWGTDAHGDAHFYFPARGARSTVVTVKVWTTIGTAVINRPVWYMVTPPLGTFKVGATPSRATVGQMVQARAVARDRAGRGVRGLKVTFAWNDGTTVVKTTATTNRDGIAYSSRAVDDPGLVTVTARTRSGSTNYKVASSFRVR